MRGWIHDPDGVLVWADTGEPVPRTLDELDDIEPPPPEYLAKAREKVGDLPYVMLRDLAFELYHMPELYEDLPGW